jgi:uncharacterized tellurite resistance protein B-like protein
VLDRIRDFFERRLVPEATGTGVDPLLLATAALLVEVMRADQHATDAERAQLLKLLHESFGLPDAELDDLVRLAEAESEEAHDLFQFTRLVSEHYDAEQRIELVRNLWRVAWADGNIDRYEEHLIRRIADLLYVRHSDFIRAKLDTGPA